jgi:hypothetical protein
MPANKYGRCRGCLVDCLNPYCNECKQKNLVSLDGKIPVLRETRYANRICDRCDQIYTPTSASSRFCELCAREANLELKRLRSKILHENGPGSGSQQVAEKNYQWKGGTSGFRKKKLDSMNGNYFCERCAKDLRSYVGNKKMFAYWCVHHKDENRYNPSLENLELLCKRCHQKVHKCWKNFLLKV